MSAFAKKKLWLHYFEQKGCTLFCIVLFFERSFFFFGGEHFVCSRPGQLRQVHLLGITPLSGDSVSESGWLLTMFGM